MARPRLSALIALLVLLAALVAAGCGEDDKKDSKSSGSDSSRSDIATPAPLEAGGEFLFCTDVPYPPAEFQEGGEFKGYEIDIAKEVGERIGVESTFQKTGFDAIIGALNGNKCDAVISSMNSTPERKEQVDFVDYMVVGQSLMVAAGNEGEITDLESLSGRTVAVQVGTTLRDAIEATSKQLEADGSEAIEIKTFPDAGAAATALQSDQVDAFFADSPNVAEYVAKQPDTFAFGGEPIDPLPVGIAIRKSDTELRDAVQEAIDAMYEDGTIAEILGEWELGDEFLLEAEGGGDAGTEEEGAMEEGDSDSMEEDAGTADATS